MALFSISQCEHSEIVEWTNAAKIEIKLNSALKGILYDFDFSRDRLVDNPKRFRWIDCEAESVERSKAGVTKFEKGSGCYAGVIRFSCSNSDDNRETGANVEDLLGD